MYSQQRCWLSLGDSKGWAADHQNTELIPSSVVDVMSVPGSHHVVGLDTMTALHTPEVMSPKSGLWLVSAASFFLQKFI